MEELFIKAEEGGMRIDKFLADELPELTRSHIQKLIKEEMIYMKNSKFIKYIKDSIK